MQDVRYATIRDGRLVPGFWQAPGADVRSSEAFLVDGDAEAFGFVVIEDPFTVPAAILRDDPRIAARSHAAAEAFGRISGRECRVLPETIGPGDRVTQGRDPRYLTFVDPTPGNGVFVFARIADELGRRRPDVPILVVEAEGTEATVAGCGLELKDRGNVFFLPDSGDPRRYLRVSRVALLPTLRWDGRGIEAIRALANGVPVIASDRGALPEVVGAAGVVLGLPERITPATRWLPTPEEVAPTYLDQTRGPGRE